jgi:hypothetical protein
VLKQPLEEARQVKLVVDAANCTSSNLLFQIPKAYDIAIVGTSLLLCDCNTFDYCHLLQEISENFSKALCLSVHNCWVTLILRRRKRDRRVWMRIPIQHNPIKRCIRFSPALDQWNLLYHASKSITDSLLLQRIFSKCRKKRKMLRLCMRLNNPKGHADLRAKKLKDWLKEKLGVLNSLSNALQVWV